MKKIPRVAYAFLLACLVGIYIMYISYNVQKAPIDIVEAVENKEETSCKYDFCSVTNSPHYLIHTPVCTIPDFNPNDEIIKKYTVENPQEIRCSEEDPITEDVGLYLIYYEERLPKYVHTFLCTYQGIRRLEQDPKIHYNRTCDRSQTLTAKMPITQRKTLIEEDGIYVKCIDIHINETFYENVHIFIQPRRAEQKRKQYHQMESILGFMKNQRNKEDLSVIIMGIDAVSRGNLRRNMPKTFKYLTNDLHVIDLKGYNKVADNTHPNIVPILLGISQEQFGKHPCRFNGKTYPSRYDDCPVIWKEFARKGYVTAYAEDYPSIGVFHYNQIGFCKEPTNYYNRPYFLFSDNKIPKQGHACQGGRSSISMIFNYSLAVAEELKDIPYFGFYWSGSLTHDWVMGLSRADQTTQKYLMSLKEKGVLDHTILFFISDHGYRHGAFRETYAGMLEERLPYIMIAFPDWFIQKYQNAMKNMKINTRRLTSNFDIYATLQDILKGTYADPEQGTTYGGFGHSLFTEVPLNRTCSDAGISEHYCTCEQTKETNATDSSVLKAADSAIEAINKLLEPYPQCVQLTLDKVIMGRVKTASNTTSPRRKETISHFYIVTFATKPGGAHMEASVRSQNGANFELIAEVSRVNLYGNQSHCIDHQVYRKYCYCKDLLPKN